MAQQYGYGYGQYQTYGYGQVGYGVQPVTYPQARMPFPPQPVGYATPTNYQAQSKPSTSVMPPPPPPPGTGMYYTGQHSMPPQPPTASAVGPTPSTPPQQPFYPGYQHYKAPHQQYNYSSHQTATPTSAAQTPSVGYQPSPPRSAPSTSVSTPRPPISYPTYNQVGYNSPPSPWYPKPPPPSSPSPAHSTTYTPQQRKVIEQYIHQQQATPTLGGGGRGGGMVGGGPQYKKPAAQIYYCEVCKISCASAFTYKTHLEGKLHKKKIQIQQNQTSSPTGSSTTAQGFTCELCTVSCTSRDAFEAHVKGAKHTKTVNLHRRLGKPIPDVKIPAITASTTSKAVASIAQKEGKVIQVSAPRIMFVGGQKLSSTGATEASSQPIKVYPPGTALPSLMGASGGEKETEKSPVGGTSDSTPVSTEGGGGSEEAEPDPVGEDLVLEVKNDPAFPHARFKCTMCDCYFNDDYARRMHVKGRRHRLNFKKTYQPDLFVEPTKQQKKELDKRRKSAEQRRGERRSAPMGGGGGGPPDVEELRRQEAAELARMYAREPPAGPNGFDPYYHGPEEEEFYGRGPWGWEDEPPLFPMPAPPPRNPHDDKLVVSKHSSIYPQEAELKAVELVVDNTEKVLKLISDDLLEELCKLRAAGQSELEAGREIQKDESLRQLKGVMRVGAFARGLLLKGECNVELVLMCADKPTHNLFGTVAEMLPAKFESLESENVYNMTPEPGKANFLIISQVGDFPVKVTVTLTSPLMREEPSPEQYLADQETGVLDRSSCLAALAALRHTKWFQAMAHGLPSCVIVLRVLKDICRRVPAWGVLDSWMLELLVQKCITSANPDFTKPGDVFRRVMECVASGVFLPGGTGLMDPCEKGMQDAAAGLTAQERANITLSAQHALRLIAFEKLHLVLGVEPLPPPGTHRKRDREAAQLSAEDAIETEAKKPRTEEQ